MYDAAILIGRFQPPHAGHLALVQAALAQARQLLIVLGSAWQARTPKNPLHWQERAQLLRACLPADQQARVRFVPLRDHYDQERWAQALRAAVTQALPPGAHIALVGHDKDADTAYLQAFPEWPLIRLPRLAPVDATHIRHAYWSATPATLEAALAALGTHLPPASHAWLRDFAHTPPYEALQHEWRVLQSYHAAWSGAPYPPVFVTVDALLRCQGHLLLVRRAQAPGRGLWALPGGFVEPRDTLWQACLRELREETALPLAPQALRAALRCVRVFDHPQRSQRGRTITHVHCFDLPDLSLPVVQGGDDAALAQWVPEEALPGLESAFFEDHFHILRQFLDLPEPTTAQA